MRKVKQISIFLAMLLIVTSMLSSFTFAASTYVLIQNLDVPSEDPIKTDLEHKFAITGPDIERSFSNVYLPNDWAVPDSTLLSIDPLRRKSAFDAHPYTLKVENVASFNPESDKYFLLQTINMPHSSISPYSGATAMLKSNYDDFSACQGSSECLITKGDFCVEVAKITMDEFTNGLSKIEEFKLDQHVSCGDVSSNEIFSVSTSPRYTLPLAIGCEGYQLRLTERSDGDWPNTGNSFFEDVEGGKKIRKYKDDNTLEIFLEENGKILQSINFLAQDFSDNSGGMSWEIWCRDPLFADDEEGVCTGKYGADAWNPDIPDGNKCCEASDIGEYRRVDNDGFICAEAGWEAVTDCNLEFLDAQNLRITDLPPNACVGEVLREGPAGSEQEYLPTGNAWHQAVGSCEKIWVGTSVYLDVNAGGVIPPPSPTDADGDGRQTASDCNDNNPNLQDEIMCFVPGETVCSNVQLCLSTCPSLPEEHCYDYSDNDCNGLIDMADPFCEGFDECDPDDPDCNFPTPLVLFGTELIPLAEMGLNSVTGMVASDTCTCVNRAVQGTGDCSPGRSPTCTSPTVCACRAQEGGGDDETGDLGGRERAEGVDYNYWAECPFSANPPPTPKNHMDPDEILGGGFNFNEPYPYNSPDRNVTDGMLVCLDGEVSEQYYCVMNLLPENLYAEWVTNLDDEVYQIACEAYNYTPTGTLCCGEPEDIGENYNDPGSVVGACHKQVAVENKEFMKDENGNNITKVIVDSGEFLGCKLTLENDAALFEISDVNGDALIRTVNECTVTAEHYCSRTGEWIRQEDRLAGDDVCTKRSIYDKHKGFCPGTLECFKNPAEGCVDNGYYSDDSYCYEGNWTTRTRLVAEKLLEIAEGESSFRIQCDDAQTSFLRIDPDQPTSNVPKFCSLRMANEEVILGVAANQGDINGFISALHQAYKTAYLIGEDLALDDAFNLHECDASKKDFELCLETPRFDVYYHNETELAIISPKISISPGWIAGLIEWLRSLFGIERSGVQKLKDFDKMYIQSTNSGAQEVKSFYQQRWNDQSQEYDTYITLEYVGVDPGLGIIEGLIEAENIETVDGNVLIIKNPHPSQTSVWNTLINARI